MTSQGGLLLVVSSALHLSNQAVPMHDTNDTLIHSRVRATL